MNNFDPAEKRVIADHLIEDEETSEMVTRMEREADEEGQMKHNEPQLGAYHDIIEYAHQRIAKATDAEVESAYWLLYEDSDGMLESMFRSEHSNRQSAPRRKGSGRHSQA